MTNTTPAPGIDEQIARISRRVELARELNQADPLIDDIAIYSAILTTLRAHKALMEAERPEPVAWRVYVEENGSMVSYGFPYDNVESAHQDAALPMARGQRAEVRPLYGPDLLAAYERMRVERDENYAEYLRVHKEKVDHFMARITAESKLNALIALMKEPDEEMQRAGWNEYLSDMKGGLQRFALTFKAMSAVALRKVIGEG